MTRQSIDVQHVNNVKRRGFRVGFKMPRSSGDQHSRKTIMLKLKSGTRAPLATTPITPGDWKRPPGLGRPWRPPRPGRPRII